MLYLHPWEIDDSQPRLQASWKSRTRQYMGLAGMRSKLERLLRDFTLATIYDAVYLPLRSRRDLDASVAHQDIGVSAYEPAPNP